MNMISAIILAICLHQTVAITCPGLGVFNSDGAFAEFPEPTCPGDETLELIYTMYTTDDANTGERFDRNSVPSIFNPARPTLWITHGWNSNGGSNWLHDMKDLFLANIVGGNCVIIGWGGRGGSENVLYPQPASTTRTVGAETAETMMNLTINGAGSMDLMHCSGHSLGSHVCGHTGRWAADAGMIPGRITGMDPAGPLFITNNNRSVGIFTDCGQFVDIINTDWTSGSTPRPTENATVLGHQNYFPNDGHDQPGCGSDGCSHSIAHDFFHYSIEQDCFIARERCTATNDLPGSCTPCVGACGLMGYGATRNNEDGIYRLETNALAPHCQS